MDQGSNKNHSPAYNFTPTVTKFCVMWEGLSLPHYTKFGNCRCKIVDSRSFHSWSLIHGLRWSGLIKVGPGVDIEWFVDWGGKLFTLIHSLSINIILIHLTFEKNDSDMAEYRSKMYLYFGCMHFYPDHKLTMNQNIQIIEKLEL